jgi:hypothetical protein
VKGNIVKKLNGNVVFKKETKCYVEQSQVGKVLFEVFMSSKLAQYAMAKCAGIVHHCKE